MTKKSAEQRVTLQHHAADLAQRVADLDDELDKAHQDAISAAVERDTLRARLAASEASDAESVRMYRSARDERDDLRAQMAEIEQHDPVAYITDDGKMLVFADRVEHAGTMRPLYARPHLGDGDAMRLAVRLGMDITSYRTTITATVDGWDDWASVAHDGTEPDKLRALREAVTLCAAAVGERMQKGGA